VLPPCAQSSEFYAIHNTTIGVVNNGCLALARDKTGYDFHSGMSAQLACRPRRNPFRRVRCK